jgi:hypothetical protein
VQYPRKRQKGIARRTRLPAIRGLSAKVGEELAAMLRDPSRRDIAKVIYADM